MFGTSPYSFDPKHQVHSLDTNSLANLDEGRTNLHRSPIAKSADETLPRYLSETSSAVRNFLSDINFPQVCQQADHIWDGSRAANHAHALSNGTAGRVLEAEDCRRRENGCHGIQ
jgi:hypothetical protein